MVEENNNRSDSVWHGGTPTLVFKTWERTEAELIKGQGITCMLSSDITHSIYPFTMDGLGEIRIYVPEEKFPEASELIEAYSKETIEPEDRLPESG
jgi:hypothetical protein